MSAELPRSPANYVARLRNSPRLPHASEKHGYRPQVGSKTATALNAENAENAENSVNQGKGKRQRRQILTAAGNGPFRAATARERNAENGDRLGNGKQRTARGPHAKPQRRRGAVGK